MLFVLGVRRRLSASREATCAGGLVLGILMGAEGQGERCAGAPEDNAVALMVADASLEASGGSGIGIARSASDSVHIEDVCSAPGWVRVAA